MTNTLKLPRSLCRGDLRLGDAAIECHVLDDERRVISARGAVGALNGSGSEDGAKYGNSARMIARILGENSGIELEPRIRFAIPGAPPGFGYPAEILPRLCAAITDRALLGRLHHKQARVAAQARRIEKALAGVGIIALVDEVTGYQAKRAPDALAHLFEAYLLPEPGKWQRIVPEALYVELARLYGFTYAEGQQLKPPFFRSWTWQYVYDVLPPDVRGELRRRNPTPHEGGPRHHQHLTGRVREVLSAHLLRLVTVLRQSAHVADFHMRFEREFKGAGLQLPLEPRRN